MAVPPSRRNWLAQNQPLQSTWLNTNDKQIGKKLVMMVMMTMVMLQVEPVMVSERCTCRREVDPLQAIRLLASSHNYSTLGGRFPRKIRFNNIIIFSPLKNHCNLNGNWNHLKVRSLSLIPSQ